MMRRPVHRSRGMTLIEVMVSLAVMSMIVVAVWSGFRGTLDGMAASEKIQMRYAIVRNGLSRMESELTMAYLSFNRPMDEARHFTLFEGRDGFNTDDLTFSSFSHLRMRKDANESDQSLIQYFIETDPEDSSRRHLYRREARRLTGDKPERLGEYFPAYVMIEDVVEFDVKYWDTKQNEWLDEWATMRNDMQPDRLPPRVKIRIGALDELGERVDIVTQVAIPMQEKIDLGKD
jgi:general secretion pathway protein J